MTSPSSHIMQMTIFRVSTVSITIFMCKKIIGWKFVFLNFDKKHVLSTFCLHIYIVICHKNASFFLLVASLVSTQQHKTEMQEYIKWLVDAFFIVFISATKYKIQKKVGPSEKYINGTYGKIRGIKGTNFSLAMCNFLKIPV